VLWQRTGKTFEWLKPLEAKLKLEALPTITSSADFKQLAVAFKRVRNIAKELDTADYVRARLARFENLNALPEPAEQALLAELQRREPVILEALDQRAYREAFAEAAKFGPGVDRFFKEVFVMVDDQSVKTARLTLLRRLESLILRLADISEIATDDGRQA
jgi:glycyl-tRNA synthetase beta chain